MLQSAHGGNVDEICRLSGVNPDTMVDFSSNVSPFVPEKLIRGLIRASINTIGRYPDRENLELRRVIAKRLGVPIECTVVGNGAADLIYRAVFTLRPQKGLIVAPTFSEYAKALHYAGAKVDFFTTDLRNKFQVSLDELIRQIKEHDTVFLCNPNNPTGQTVGKIELRAMIQEFSRKKITLLLDESFIDWCEENSMYSEAASNGRILVIRSMTKFYGLAGLRLGYAVADKRTTRRISACGQPWPVNGIAQTVGAGLLRNREIMLESREQLIKERDYLYRRLCRNMKLQPYPTQANFIFIRIKGLSSTELTHALMKKGIWVRDCSNFRGLDRQWIRIAVRKRKENMRLIKTLEKVLA